MAGQQTGDYTVMTALTAANDAEFATARSNAVAGDIIELTGSSYSGFTWLTSYGSEVIVRGSDPNNRPTIDFQGFNTAKIDGANNLTFEDIIFSKPWTSGDADQENLWSADNSTNITFTRCKMIGGTNTNNNNVSNGRFLHSIGTSGGPFTFTDCEFTKWTKAVVAGGPNGWTFTRCSFHDIRSDGITFDDVDDALFDRCWFYDFAIGVGAGHPDMIQATRSASRVSGCHNWTIRYCVFDASYGRYGQGLFGGDGGQSVGGYGTVWRHTGWNVHDNIFYIDHDNVCSVFALDDSTFTRNALFEVENGYPFNATPKLGSANGSNNTFDSNYADTYQTGASPTQTNNITATQADLTTNVNVLADETYPTAGVVGTLTNDGYHDYQVKSGGTMDTQGAFPAIMAREAGVAGVGVEPHPDYPGGYRAGGGLQTLPSGSVSATVTVP